MKDLQFFNFKGQDVRVVWLEDKNDWWYVFTDVCKILGLGNPGQVAATRLKKEGCIILNDITDALGRPRETLCVNLQNYLRAIMQSRKSEAEAFQDWVFEEVLPTIVKTGTYSVHPQPKAISEFELFNMPQELRQAIEAEEDQILSMTKHVNFLKYGEQLRYPEQARIRGKRHTDRPRVFVFEGVQVTQLMISFSQEVA